MKYLVIIVAVVFLATNFAWAKTEQPEITEYQFEVEGIVCAGCIKSIEAVLLNVPGVKKAKVNLEERRAKVVAERGKLNAQDLIQVIEQTSNVYGFKYKVTEVAERLQVEGMTCAGCPPRVKSALSKIDGVKDVKVSLKDNGATVTYDPRKVSTSQLLEAINKIGYRASLPLSVEPVYSSEVNELMTSFGITSLPQGKIAPDFTLKDLDGKQVSLSDYQGKIVFLNFWATWCPSCREEMPSMEKLYQRFKGEDFVMLAVDLRESRSTVKDFAREYKLNFPILLDLRGQIGDTYGVRAIPTTYFINRQGKLISKAVGARDWASEEAFELIEHLLKE